MIGLIPRPLHAVLDYLWSLAYWFAPETLGVAGDDAARTFSKIRAGSAVPMSLLTRYELGLIRVIPFNWHLVFDLLGALAGLAAPWLLGFSKNEKARNATLGFALIELGAVLLSKAIRHKQAGCGQRAAAHDQGSAGAYRRSTVECGTRLSRRVWCRRPRPLGHGIHHREHYACDAPGNRADR